MRRDLAIAAAAALLIVLVGLVAASGPADQPAPIPSAGTGFEQGPIGLAAGLRTQAPPSAARERIVSRGTSSWYTADGLIAAAGPELRHALGRDWRGSVVRVVAGDRSVTVTLTDWCQCYKGERRERLVDLSDGAFAKLAPLAVGLVEVRIELPPGRPAPPATDVE